MMMNSNDLAGMVATVMIMAVPITWILTSHQRKMAAIIHANHRQQSNQTNDALVNEVRELKQMVYQQAIALDSLTSQVKGSNGHVAADQPLSARLGSDRPSS